MSELRKGVHCTYLAGGEGVEGLWIKNKLTKMRVSCLV